MIVFHPNSLKNNNNNFSEINKILKQLKKLKIIHLFFQVLILTWVDMN